MRRLIKTWRFARRSKVSYRQAKAIAAQAPEIIDLDLDLSKIPRDAEIMSAQVVQVPACMDCQKECNETRH